VSLGGSHLIGKNRSRSFQLPVFPARQRVLLHFYIWRYAHALHSFTVKQYIEHRQIK
jgi:hypothetical protein